MGMIWVLVADKSRAKLFKMKGRAAELTPDREWQHPSVRTAGAVENETSENTSDIVESKNYEAELFAQELISEMEKGAASGCFTRLYLIASPEFLGLLRKKMGASLQDMVEDEVAKNLTAMDASEIRKYLSGAL